MVMFKNKCECNFTEITIEPVGGGGSFDVKQGLYLDEHLVTELTPDTDFKVGRDSLRVSTLYPLLILMYK